jgi:K+-transporting ATPase ATPase C chain
MKTFLQSLRYLLLLVALSGVVYPAAVTGAAKIFWPRQAAGSLVEERGRVVGSELIGQRFVSPRYLHPRPSAAGKEGYDATASGGTNRGPTSAELAATISAAVAEARKDRLDEVSPVPADLVTSSASGLDPHLSPDAARWQALRIARVRGVGEEAVLAVIGRHVEPRTLGLFGEPRVNVLLVNLDLDATLDPK